MSDEPKEDTLPPSRSPLEDALDQQPGVKLDAGKLRYDLVVDDALADMVAVLTFGAAKYAPGNWAKVPDGKARYFAALQRHLAAWRRGESNDAESGLPHLAHAAACLHFLQALDR